MWKNINLEECLKHINARQFAVGTDPPGARPAITISRMCGSGGRSVASKVAEYLEQHTPYGHRWTIFDRDLIKKVLEDHGMSGRLAEFLPETNKSLLSRPQLNEMKQRLRGKKPSASLIVEQTVETIWHLAERGHVILVGRAANVITAGLRNVFHVRLVGPLEDRIKRIEEVYDLDRLAALDYIKTQDAAKRHYLKDYFGEDIDDPQLYHLMVNTGRISYDEAARLIGNAVIQWFKLAPAGKN